MKKVTALILLFLISACSESSNIATTKTTSVKALNSSTNELFPLGQEPPGLTPKPFAPGLVSTKGFETQAAFAPSMKEFYYIGQAPGEKSKRYVVRYKDGQWRKSAMEFTSGVFISTDGNTMHSGGEYRERTDTGWSDKKKLGAPFDEIPIMLLTASSAGTYFFDERTEIGTIRTSRLVDGVREAPKAVGENINTGKYTAHPYIAPDESYLIFDSEREGGHGESDLYISFRQQDASWGPAINMGEDINTEYGDSHGSVTPDGKYFFYSSRKLGKGVSENDLSIFWVDAKIIENLREKTISNQNE
ncbi:MAG: hypothetical protein ACSHXY_01995 [Alphaproteobacteria bacterium]